MSDTRERLLEVAAAVFAEAGYLGTTTRRIAQDAGVNEVTLFRHFGSKDELIKAALRREREFVLGTTPAATAPPAEALREWATAFHHRLYGQRALIRRLMGELQERPDLALDPCEGADDEAKVVITYLAELQQRGVVPADADVAIAGHVLVNTLFTDAMWRDYMPAGHVPEPAVVIEHLVAFVLRGLGLGVATAQEVR